MYCKYNKIPIKKRILLVMRFITLFLMLGMNISYAINSYSQSKVLSIHVKNKTIKEVFSEIEKNSEFIFIYYDDKLELNKKVSIDVTGENIMNILNKMFESTNIQYIISDRQIALSKKTDNLSDLANKVQQGIRVTGTVSDDAGGIMPGVNVVIRGSTFGTITDINGEFTITVPSDTSVLQFRFMGYRTQETVVGNRRIIAVTMLETAAEIGEVTIVAFGTQKKTSLVSSIESVKVSELKQPASNLTASFAGRIPGLISYQTSGEPGADNAQFFVRGVTTFGYKSEPLILIDGFESSSDDLARLQPDDIESFSILKDASATVLYGARGANGIIIVTTKSGMEGDPKISVRLDVNVAMPTQIPEVVDGITYMRLYNQAMMSQGLEPFYSEQKILSTINGEHPLVYPNTDWYDVLFNKHTVNTKANMNVSGGGKVATYYVAGGYDNETGLLKVDGRNNFNNNINIDRFHIRNNVIFNLGKTTKLDVRLQGRYEKFIGPHRSAGDIFKMVMNSNPVDFPAVFEPDAANLYTRHILFGSAYFETNAMTNPYAEMVRGYQTRDESTVTAMATLSQDMDALVKGLKFQAKASVNTWSKYSSTRTYTPFLYSVDTYNQITSEYTLYNLNPNTGQAYLGEVSPGRDASAQYYFEARLNWDRTFGKHSVGAMTVVLAQENLLTGGDSRSIFETLPERNMGNSGRVNYSYDDRYFLEFAYGYNGSEKFTGSKRFGFFPSIGAAWMVSNEAFWGEQLKNIVNQLKFRFTFGLVGNDAIAERKDRFFFLSDITSSSSYYVWGETFSTGYMAYGVSRYANPDITWEVSQKYNLGVDISLFKGAPVKFQVDFFKDVRDKIYMKREHFPSTVGLEADLQGNVGKVESQGIDGSIDIQHFFNKDFWITGRANFTYATNKIVRIEEPDYRYENRRRVEHNINQQWGLVAERVFVDSYEIANSPTQVYGEYQAGDIKYADINNDGKIDDDDRIAMGYPTVPEIQYGFGLSTGYKKFDFSFFFQGNARTSFFIDAGTGEGIAPFSGRRNALAVVARDSWSETNPNIHAFWPRLTTNPTTNNLQQSSWWLRNNSFLRLKTVEAGYNFGGWDKIHLQNIRLYFTAENLFAFTPFKLWDPEVGRHGLKYPLNRRFNVGVHLNF